MISKINCWYLDHAYDIQENGPCCFQRISGSNNYTSFHSSAQYAEIKNSFEQGQWPNNYCTRCRDAENQFIGDNQSKRQSALHEYKVYNIDVDNPVKKLHSLTVDAGRYCNIQCRICNPYLSSSWVEESSELFKKYPSAAKWIINPEHFPTGTKVYPSTKFNFDDDISELKHVHFTGGEPLYSTDLNPIMDHILEKAGPNCLISIMTNGTLSYKSVRSLSKFKQVSIILSIDGVEKTAEFIRTGCDWATVDKNIKEYVEIGANLNYHPTYGVLNLFGVVELTEYATAMGIKTSSEKGFVDHLPHLSYSVLTDDEKTSVLEYLNSAQLTSIAERVQAAVYNPVDRQNFFDFMEHTRQFHGMFWGDYLPELYALMTNKM
jgi:hypothetical protein